MEASRSMRFYLVVAVVMLLIAAGCACSSAKPKGTPALPVIGGTASISYTGDVGDPFVLPLAGSAGYALFGTDDWPSHVPTASTSDLRTWKQGPDALPVLPAWSAADPDNSQTWAPAALRTATDYVLYISVVEAASHRHCIAVTTSATPLGPYQDRRGSPIVCQREIGGSIDPSVFHDQRGGLHLVWKSDGNCCGLPAQIWQQDLKPDGLDVSGVPHLLLTATQVWQAGIIENPAVIPARAGGLWLFYSGNEFDAVGYATGLAYCASLTGPCRETADHAFLAGTPTQFAPGGLDFFRTGKGELWASFATWSMPPRNGRFFCCRPLNVVRVLQS